MFTNGLNELRVFDILPVDLDQIKKQNINNKKYKFFLFYKDTFLFPYRMNEYNYSPKIYYYVSPPVIGKSYVVVMKLFEDIKDFILEKNASDASLTMNKSCKDIIVNSRSLSNYLLMDFYEGNISDFLYNMDRSKNIDYYREFIIRTLIEAVKCFYDFGLFYIDVKLAQLLYNNNGNKLPHIVLGDLSLSHNKGIGYAATFPSPYFDRLRRPNLIDIEWGIMVAILETYVSTSISVLQSPFKYKNVPGPKEYTVEWDATERKQLFKDVKELIRRSRKIEHSPILLDVAQLIFDQKGKKSIGLDTILDMIN